MQTKVNGIRLFFSLLLMAGSVCGSSAQSADPATFDFENGELHGFYGGMNAPALANDTGIAYTGSASMKVTCGAIGTNEVQLDSPGVIAAGTPVDFYVYVPAGMSASFQPFILDGSWGWSASWADKSSIPNDTWTRVSVLVPQNAVLPVNRLGIQIIADTAGSLWIDSIRCVSSVSVDKSGLNDAIADAQILLDTAVEGEKVGEYAPGSKAVFAQAISAAAAVSGNDYATQSEVDSAETSLAIATKQFESAKNSVLPPASLSLEVLDNAIRLNWEASANADLYIVRRAPRYQGPYDVLASDLAGLSYTDTRANAKTIYYYTVAAVKEGVESKPAPYVYGRILAQSQLQDLPLFVNTIPGGWVGGDSDCIEAPGSLFPIDDQQTCNNLPSLRVNVTKNGTWWCGLLAGQSWCTYDLEEYYANGSLEFNIKGLEGGESFTVGFYDKVPEREPLERGADFPLPTFVNVTREWQHVSIPLKSMIDSSLCDLKSISYLRFNKDYGTSKQVFTVWVNDLRIVSPDSEKIYAAVKVNQLGYTPKAEKYALVSCFDGVYPLSEDTGFSVKNAVDGSVVFSGKLKKVSELDEKVSGERVFAANFTKLTKEGSYYITVDAAGVPDSYEFKIGDSIYESLVVASSRYFYLQRANIPLTEEHAGTWAREDYTPSDFHAPLESDLAGPARDVSLGWYDAGDFGKYTNAGAMAISDLLWAYLLFPDQFSDGRLDIPESGNSVPDILDEVKYELDFLLKMQDSDGGFFHMVQGGTVKEDNVRYIRDKRGNTGLIKPTSHTASAVGVLAHAATVFKKIDSAYAQTLLNAAEAGWKYLENNPDLVISLSGPYEDNNDKDDRLYAAGALFNATKDAKYDEYFLAHYSEFADFFDNPANAHGVGDPTMTAFFLYNGSAGADREERAWFKGKFGIWRSVQMGRAIANPWRNTLRYYDYYWGSNLPVLCTSMDLVIGSKMFGEYTGQVVNVVRSNLNYVLGVNPMSFSYVSGFGDNSMRRTFSGIYNGDGKQGIPDGYLAGGANMYQGSWFSRFAGKCYNDINTEWTTNEHTIYWNSGLVFSAALVNEESEKKAGNPVFVIGIPEKRAIRPGESAKIRVIAVSDDFRLVDLTSATFAYESNRPDIAAVDESGVVTGLKKGAVTIIVTVKYGAYELHASVKIIVKSDACFRK